MKDVFFNDNEPYITKWLGSLFPEATIDGRGIQEIQASELVRFRRLHFFAGIGGWEVALELSNWGGREVWTASCPCQPLSRAGRRRCEKDERHLWPEFYRLISECRPRTILGEQVDGKDGLEWLDGVALDLEELGYAFAATSMSAACVNAPHVRQRIYWVANACGARRERLEPDERTSCGAPQALAIHCDSFARARSAVDGDVGNLLLADGLSVAVERDAIKGYGNSIVPEVAAEFIKAFMEAEKEMVS